MILFAYAGNMDVDCFAETVPSAKKIGVAKLPGYNFVYNKTADDQSSKANIIQSDNPDENVWGILIQLEDHEKSNFFNPETWSSDFKLETVTCLDQDDEIYHAEAFVAQPHAINSHLLPYDWYHKRIVKLAKNAKLPARYVNKIFLMNYKIDPDTGRRQEKLKTLKYNQSGGLASYLF